MPQIMMETPSNTIFSAPPAAHENPFIQKIPTRAATDFAPASLGLRASAFLVDYILTLLVLGVAISIATVCKSAFPTLANWIVNLGYLATLLFVAWNWFFLCVRDGQRIGQRLVGLRIIRTDGAMLGYRTVVLRHLIGYPLSLLCLGLGFLWMIIDPKQRGWHDKLAGTLIVKG
ncbi:MAG: RDD family protein [Acidobacteria bacterium]|nr:RDD family protein [Acidobacteriota bacterium]